MDIGMRLLALRNQKKMSQREMAERTGVQISHISRVERGHTVPTVETLERMARALNVQLYQIFYQSRPNIPNPSRRKSVDNTLWGSTGYEVRRLEKFCRLFSRMKERDLNLLLLVAGKMVRNRKIAAVKIVR